MQDAKVRVILTAEQVGDMELAAGWHTCCVSFLISALEMVQAFTIPVIWSAGKFWMLPAVLT
jgi:hypothetical protein